MSSSSRGAEIWQKARAQRARNMRERSERNVSSLHINEYLDPGTFWRPPPLKKPAPRCHHHPIRITTGPRNHHHCHHGPLEDPKRFQKMPKAALPKMGVSPRREPHFCDTQAHSDPSWLLFLVRPGLSWAMVASSWLIFVQYKPDLGPPWPILAYLD